MVSCMTRLRTSLEDNNRWLPGSHVYSRDETHLSMPNAPGTYVDLIDLDGDRVIVELSPGDQEFLNHPPRNTPERASSLSYLQRS